MATRIRNSAPKSPHKSTPAKPTAGAAASRYNKANPGISATTTTTAADTADQNTPPQQTARPAATEQPQAATNDQQTNAHPNHTPDSKTGGPHPSPRPTN